jgi:hypothetical protein
MKSAASRKPAAQTAASIIAAAPELDSFAPAYDANFGWPEDAPTNGIAIAPPIDWQPGDPNPEASTPEASGLTVVPKRITLREHIEGTDAIIRTIGDLDEEDLTPEAKDELSAMLISALAGTRKKVDATAAAIAGLEHRLAADKAERDRLAKRVQRDERQLERLEDYVLAVLEASNLDKIDGETSTLARRPNPPSVVPDTSVAGPLAREFVREPKPAPWSEDKTAIKTAIAAGRQIPGFAVGRSIRLVRS